MRSPRKKQAIQTLPDTDVGGDHRPNPVLHDQIARHAYAFYERRGRVDGFHLEDWLKAELEVLTEITIH